MDPLPFNLLLQILVLTWLWRLSRRLAGRSHKKIKIRIMRVRLIRVSVLSLPLVSMQLQSPKQSDTWVFEYYWEKFYIIVCSICILICKDYIENLVMSRILQIEWLIIMILQILSYKMICQHLNTTKKVIEENIYLLYNWCDIIHIYYMSIFVNFLVVK